MENVSREEFESLKSQLGDMDRDGSRNFQSVLKARHDKFFIWFGIIIILAILLSLIFTYWQVDVSQHHWCDALNTLTAHPVPKPANPAVNPSREEAYVLYREFVGLKNQFGC